MIRVAMVLAAGDTTSGAGAQRRERYRKLAEPLASEDTAVRMADEGDAADVFLVVPSVQEHPIVSSPPLRTVLLGCARGTGFEATDRTGVAGAVDEVSVDYWAWGLAATMTPWLVARRALLHDPGWNHSLVVPPDIGVGSHPDEPDLPSLLRRYLHEVARSAPS